MTRARIALVPIAIVLAVAQAACLAKPAGVGNGCTPGQQSGCACGGGRSGFQVCRDDGAGFESCVCDDSSRPDAGVSDEASADASPDALDDNNSSFEPPDGLGGAEFACGVSVGSYRGVPSYSNGSQWNVHGCNDACQGDFPAPLACTATYDGCTGSVVTLRTPHGIAYQCVEYVRRYFVARYGITLRCAGNAVDYWLAPDPHFDTKWMNGATTDPPRPDDVVVFRRGPSDAVGHIAIVRRVTATHAYLVQQNVTHGSTDANYPLLLARDATGRISLVDDGGYLGAYGVLGWMRSTSLDPMACATDGTCPDGYTCAAGACTPITATPACGNGVREGTEACDGADLGGATCASLGFSAGSLACSSACTCVTQACCYDQCAAGASRCLDAATHETCGDHDGDGCLDWGAGETCSLGCTGSTCATPTCGNGVREGSEACDRADLGGATCASFGFDAGALACAPSCAFTTNACCTNACSPGATRCLDASTRQTCIDHDGDGCVEWGGNTACGGPCTGWACASTWCGDGVKNGSESCDGSDLGGTSCATLGYSSGTLACSASCTLSTAGCCTDACARGATRCVDAGTQQICGDYDADGCTEWGGNTACAGPCTGNACANAWCGNGVKDGAEACDGSDFGGATCTSLGYDAGSLACSPVCSLSSAGCCTSECAQGAATCVSSTTRRTCGQYDADACFEWSAPSTCTYACSNGTCCGGAGQPCCPGTTCSSGLVCKTATSTCQTDTTPTTTAYRFVSLCSSAHWESIGNACYPSSSGPTVGCGCGATTVNAGCTPGTCWQRESTFHTYLQDPGYGSFSAIYHCFEGGANRYSRAGCASYGDPTSIGWIANAPVGSWSTPIYLCQWTASGVSEQFFTFATSECSNAGGTLVAPSPYGYVMP